MNKKILFLLTFLSFSMISYAQLFTQIKLHTPHYYPGEIYFINGHSESFDEVELPMTWKNSIKVKKNSDDKKHTEIPAENIVAIKLWHKNFANKAHVLHYVAAKKVGALSPHQWGFPIMKSEWGVLYQCEQYYEIKNKTGDLQAVILTSSNSSTPTPYYMKKWDWEFAELIGVDGEFYRKKKVAKLFAESEKIAEDIAKGQLRLYDMQYILDQMEITSKRVKENTSAPTLTTDSVKNGQIGDDE